MACRKPGGRCWYATISPRSPARSASQSWPRDRPGCGAAREFLPVRHSRNIVTLGEVETPLVHFPRLQAGRGALWVKDESRLPTGSFKARGLCMAVSMAKELGIRKVAMPTNGNAGAALAAYATRAGIEAYVFCPEDTPEINVRRSPPQGAQVWRVNGLINDCGRIVAAGKDPMGWFDFSTLKEPYRIEGKKTMGLELADQLGWQCARRDPLSDRWRHRIDWHVEGLRRAAGNRLAHRQAAANGGGAG